MAGTIDYYDLAGNPITRDRERTVKTDWETMMRSSPVNFAIPKDSDVPHPAGPYHVLAILQTFDDEWIIFLRGYNGLPSFAMQVHDIVAANTFRRIGREDEMPDHLRAILLRPAPVLLRGQLHTVIVHAGGLARVKGPLNPAPYAVIKALVGAGEDGLDLKQLLSVSGRSSAREILKGLTADEHWAAVIQMAGKKYGRYRIVHAD